MKIRFRAMLLALLLTCAPGAAALAQGYAVIITDNRCVESFKPAVREKRAQELNAVVTRYRAALAARDETAVRKMFRINIYQGGVYGADGVIHPGASLASPSDRFLETDAPVLLKIGLGGDLMTARGVWKAPPAVKADGSPQSDVYYVADFERAPYVGIFGAWGIWRIRAYDQEAAVPPTPEAFCGLSSLSSLFPPG
jgi:hypothetical protein